MALHRSGKLAEAERLYAQILSFEPANVPAQHFFGMLRFQQGRNSEALALIRAALRLQPNSPDALSNCGLVLRAMGQSAEAIAHFDRAIALKPDHADAWNNRGGVLQILERSEEALASLDRAVALKPDFFEAFHNRGLALRHLGRFGEALASYDKAVAIQPQSAGAWNDRGLVLSDLGRHAEALASFDRTLAIMPDHSEAWSNRGVTLQSLKKFDEALASYNKALAIKPDYAEALYNRGIVLRDLKRPEEALANFSKALAIHPDYARAAYNCGIILGDLKCPEQALQSYDKALAIDPDYAEAWNSRGFTLQKLKRLEEAQESLDKALAINPFYAEALLNLGSVLCENNRIAEGFAAFARHAELVYGSPASRKEGPVVPHKLRHDREQRDYLAGGKAPDDAPAIDAMFHLADGSQLATPAVNPGNDMANIAEQWLTSKPQVVVIDNLLSDEALDKLRRFCWGSTVWRRIYEDGYLGALPEYGFACPLLAQIADELRLTFPTIFGAHPLRYLWAFKYDSLLTGTKIHGDKAAVNVNFWITPDDANLDPESGGLVIWDVAAPPEWDFSQYNGDEAASREFLARAGARPMTIPYRANRAVIFGSDLFHETDRIAFKGDYRSRRMNVTLLYGKRVSDDE